VLISEIDIAFKIMCVSFHEMSLRLCWLHVKSGLLLVVNSDGYVELLRTYVHHVHNV
jgi:hypothetical protein